MGNRKRTTCYDLEFKQAAVRLATESGRTTKDVAERLGLHPNQFTKWKRDLQEVEVVRRGRGAGRTAEQPRIQWLERELARVREERDLLKK